MPLFEAGDSTITTVRTWRTSFRQPDWLLYAVQAALGLLTNPNNWTGSATYDADDAAGIAQDVIDSFMVTMDHLGVIFPYAGDIAIPPAGALLCDGASYLRADYPDLFDVIGTTYGSVDGSHFNVPDLQRLVIAGVDTTTPASGWNLADTGGEFTHTLSSGEMPSHSHTDLGHTHGYSSALANLTSISAGVPEADALPAPSITGSGNANLTNTGGGGAHNNIQPYMAIYYVIQAVHG